MRIIAYSHRLDYTGAPLILFRLMRHLRARHEIVVLLPRHGDVGALRQDYEAAGIECVAYIDARKYDVLVANTLMSFDVVKKAQGQLPILWWIHEPAGGVEWLTTGRVDAKAFGVPDAVVFPTRWQYETLYRPYVGGRRHAIVPYGIGIDPHVGPPPANRDPADLHLLQLGIVAARKGVDVTLRALKRLANPRIKLTLMGSCIFQPNFVAQVTATIAGHSVLNQTVEVTGEQPPAVAQSHMAHCDALLFPTRDDLITLTILEALLHRRCVLSSDFGPIPETVMHDQTGLLSPVGDDAALAANIDRIFHDRGLIKRLGDAGRAIYDHKHTFTAHAQGMEAEIAAVARR
ncbi:MAG: glycosyltransferase family 4 protein [Alphaproteobacteria bacterium]|nr:glycosyltransferase family 4 protein [Alphaproteobacteria bacterium]